jgi:hypothetical protein
VVGNQGRANAPRRIHLLARVIRDWFSTSERIRSFAPRRDSEANLSRKTNLKSTISGSSGSLHNHLSHSESQDEATARKTRLNEEAGAWTPPASSRTGLSVCLQRAAALSLSPQCRPVEMFQQRTEMHIQNHKHQDCAQA